MITSCWKIGRTKQRNHFYHACALQSYHNKRRNSIPKRIHFRYVGTGNSDGALPQSTNRREEFGAVHTACHNALPLWRHHACSDLLQFPNTCSDYDAVKAGSPVTFPFACFLLLSKNSYLTFWRRNYFLSLAHSVYKMWIIQEPNKSDLWNKLHCEEEKTESIYHV
jgi:hypothetical protein